MKLLATGLLTLALLLLAALPDGLGLSRSAKEKPEAIAFSFTLPKEELTSAGVFDAKGRLIRTLWTMKALPAGQHSGHWDGRDEFENLAPRGEYEFRIIANRSRYRNIGTIGNTGQPPTPVGHTPSYMESVAVDDEGSVYTANYWDEAGADFKKWDRDGHSIYDSHYQIRNGNPNGAPYAIAVDDQYLYCSVDGWQNPPWNGKQQLQRFRRSDGKLERFTEIADNAGHIQVYEFARKLIPKDTSDSDFKLMKQPLRALAVSGDLLYACDAVGGKVHRFHKVTGQARGSFPVKLPNALAIGPKGRVWVGHEHTKVTAFDADGGNARSMLTDLGEVEALAFGPKGQLYVADGKAGQVKIYDVAEDRLSLARTLGQLARPGDRAADHFYQLRGVAVDPQGNVITIQTELPSGAHVAKWSPQGKLLWEQMGLENVSLGNYSKDDPDEFISLLFHRYRLTDRQKGRWEYLGNLFAGDRSYLLEVHGIPRLLRRDGHDLFFTARGDGMQVYRRQDNALVPAALIGGREPDPFGNRDKQGGQREWTWHDANGDGKVGKDEINWFKRPGESDYFHFGMNVDQQGNLLYCHHYKKSVEEIPLLKLDRLGNPVYDWAKARQVGAPDVSPLKFLPLMAVRSDDGTIYAFGRSDAWKEPRKSAAHMGGWVVCRYDNDGQQLWAAKLPDVCPGMDAIPGGGVILGSCEKATLYHYTADGLLIGSMSPGEAAGNVCGWLDNTACVAVNRDPRDGLVDVFNEDDSLSRILWYRVDDRDIVTIKGKLQR
jgi:hypothetical protein